MLVLLLCNFLITSVVDFRRGCNDCSEIQCFTISLVSRSTPLVYPDILLPFYFKHCQLLQVLLNTRSFSIAGKKIVYICTQPQMVATFAVCYSFKRIQNGGKCLKHSLLINALYIIHKNLKLFSCFIIR